MHCARTPRQSVTRAHWILGKQTCQIETTQFAGNFSLGQMSCKSFLKSQVGIISLGAFQVFCEARANTRSP